MLELEDALLEAQREAGAAREAAGGAPLEVPPKAPRADTEAAQANGPSSASEHFTDAARASKDFTDGLSSASELSTDAASDAAQTECSEAGMAPETQQSSDALHEQAGLLEPAPAEPGSAPEDAVQAAAAEQQLQPVQIPSEALAAGSAGPVLDTTAGAAEAEAALARQEQELPEEVQQAAGASEQLAEASQESAEAMQQLDRAAGASDEVSQALQPASEQLAGISKAAAESPGPPQAQPDLGILLSNYPSSASGNASTATSSAGLTEHLGSFFDSIRTKDEQAVKVDASIVGLAARRQSPLQRRLPARSREGWTSLPGGPRRSLKLSVNPRMQTRYRRRVGAAGLHCMPAAQQRSALPEQPLGNDVAIEARSAIVTYNACIPCSFSRGLPLLQVAQGFG